jgi:hypothetical protein
MLYDLVYDMIQLKYIRGFSQNNLMRAILENNKSGKIGFLKKDIKPNFPL